MVQVINKYEDEQGIRAEKIVNRIIKYAPPECLNELKVIELLGKDPINNCFASYSKSEGKIELYVGDIIGWQPWILRKTYILPYLEIGIALGHELDHHVNRNKNVMEKEKLAENNALKYIYPSFGVFKPVAKLFSIMARYVIHRKEK